MKKSKNRALRTACFQMNEHLFENIDALIQCVCWGLRMLTIQYCFLFLKWIEKVLKYFIKVIPVSFLVTVSFLVVLSFDFIGMSCFKEVLFDDQLSKQFRYFGHYLAIPINHKWSYSQTVINRVKPCCFSFPLKPLQFGIMKKFWIE